MEKLEAICLKIIRLSFYLILFSPLLALDWFFYCFTVSKSLWFMTFTEILFCAWLFLIIFAPKYRPQKRPLTIFFGLFLIILTAATLLGVDASRSFWSNFERMGGLLMWLHLFAFYLVTTSVFEKKKWLNFIIFSMVIATIGSGLFWLDKLGLPELPSSALGSFAGNSSFLASYLLFNLYLAIYVFIVLKKHRAEIDFLFLSRAKDVCMALTAAGIIIMSATLMASTGRAAAISFLGGLILLVFLRLALKAKSARLKRCGKFALLISLIFYLTVVILLFVPDSIVQQGFNQRTNSARPLVWQEAWSAFLEKPILGWGPENFIISSNQYFNSRLLHIGDFRFDRAHNIVFDKLIEAGILGLIGYFSIIAASIYLLWRAYLHKKTGFWTWSVLTVLFVAHFTTNLSVFDTLISYIMLAFLLAFISSVASPLPRSKTALTEKNNQKLIILPALVLAFAVFMSCFCFFVYQPAKANYAAMKALYWTDDSDQRLGAYQTFYSSAIARNSDTVSFYLVNSVINQAKEKKAPLQELITAEQCLEKVIKFSPLNYYAYVDLGKAYNAHSRISNKNKAWEAEKTLERAVQISPANQYAYWELAKTKLLLNKIDEAVALAEKALNLDYRLPHSHLFLVNLLRSVGKQELAEEKIKRAIQIIPDLAPQLEKTLIIQDINF